MTRRVERRAKRLLWKTILHLVGRAKPRSAFKGSLKSIVILAQEKLGDAILLTPLIGMLKKSIPDLQIDVVTYGLNFWFFELDPNVAMVLRGKRNYIKYFKTLKSRKYDLLFSTKDHPSFTFLYQARLIPARYRVGIQHPVHRGFFNHLIPVDFHMHVVEKNCALLDFLGIPRPSRDLRPYLPAAPVRKEIQSFAQSLRGKDIIGINLSAGSADREWPVEKWEFLLEEIRKPVTVLAMPNRIHDKKRLESRFSRVLASPDTKSIFEAGEILHRLRLLISPDTAMVHAASCFNVPVVGLYKADIVHLERFHPYGIRYRMAVSKTGRVSDIPVQNVLQAVQEILNG
jgi:heptosyltransferase-3